MISKSLKTIEIMASWCFELCHTSPHNTERLSTVLNQAEHWRINAFELWCWRRFLRVSWTARRPNQPILKEISPGISLEGMMLKLKLQHFGHLMEELIHWKRPWCWEGLGTGGEGDDREWDSWMALLTWRESEWTLGVGDGQVGLVCCDSWGRKESDTTEWLNWTELIEFSPFVRLF